jgi:GntR family transcriptional regulator
LFILNPQSGKPLYRQLVDQVRQMITSGNLAPGDTLPSVRSLAEEHAVNPMTISKAYALLEGEGLLERNRGKPMTVAMPRSNDALADGSRSLEQPVRALVLSARNLKLEKHDVIALLEKTWEET